jgi:hypothetical protein
MVTAKQFTCPTCGFSVVTPAGMSDLMKHVTMHKESQHPDMQMSESELLAKVKDIELWGAAPGKMAGDNKGAEEPMKTENKGKYEFDDKLKEGAQKFGDEIKGIGSKIKKKIE